MPFQTKFSGLTIAHRTRRFHTLPPSPREGLSVVEDVQITVPKRESIWHIDHSTRDIMFAYGGFITTLALLA